MDTTIQKLLQDQLNKERQNSQIYSFVSVSLQNQSYDGFAKFFMKQSQQELEHAQKFAEYLISKRVNPEYRTLSGVSGVGTPLDFAKLSYTTERSTTDALEELYRQAEEAEEYQVCAFLKDLLVEQIEEETWSFDLQDLLSKTNENGWVFLDHEYGEK